MYPGNLFEMARIKRESDFRVKSSFLSYNQPEPEKSFMKKCSPQCIKTPPSPKYLSLSWILYGKGLLVHEGVGVGVAVEAS